MAIISDLMAFSAQHIFIVVLPIIIYYFTRNYLTPGVCAVPGPFLAKISNIWRFFDVANGSAEVTLYKLHRRHRDYVRLGPNVVSVWNLDALKIIYGINRGYKKTDFYKVQQQLSKGQPASTLFTTTNERFHTAIKRPISPAYSMNALKEFEPFMDTTIHTLFKRLDEFVAHNQACDIATWLQYYAFNVIGELTFSKSLGFLEQGTDIDGIIAALEKILDYSGKVGQMPWLNYVFVKNPVRQFIQGGSIGAIARFARARLDERLKQSKNVLDSPKNTHTWSRKDFPFRFLEAKEQYPEVVNDHQVFSYTVANMNAGSDTTAISLRAILYYTLKSPRIKAKLHQELNTAYQAKRISSSVSWKQSQEQLPYLDAVIKEALRLHPAIGLILERIVPAEGLQLPNDGPFLPAGTIVGANPWIIHRHSVF